VDRDRLRTLRNLRHLPRFPMEAGSMSKLTYKKRENLKSSSFVFPKQRKYPIHDIAHGRNALARVSANGTPAEKAKVRAAVYRKYPSLRKGGK
jgi:hypothetical protein